MLFVSIFRIPVSVGLLESLHVSVFATKRKKKKKNFKDEMKYSETLNELLLIFALFYLNLWFKGNISTETHFLALVLFSTSTTLKYHIFGYMLNSFP